MASEFAFLDRLRTIATDPAARGLDDDAALLDGWVITHDSIAEGVHFRRDDPPSSIGWKLVAVNLSDLAAKGATPRAALMTASLSDGDGRWENRFLDGVAAACDAYGLALVGGDTIALPEGAPRVFSLTAIGRAGEAVPARSGGRPGDGLWLVGTLGDSGAGLDILAKDKDAEGPLVEAYRQPVPQLAAGQALAPRARAMMDVSDGLLLDLARMIAACGCGAAVDLDALPLSRAFIAERGQDRRARLFAATAGDDYALLAALPSNLDPGLSLSLPAGTQCVRIGHLTDGRDIILSDAAGEVPLPERLGYAHDRPQSPPALARARRPDVRDRLRAAADRSLKARPKR
ncbi:thiamine-phosphate kinase [Sphingomonas sp. ASV193]|uniref:thiamine-phosphate kinase n=1 Tax=Sphingomonas sp. ASV193 TaxID=3144405 RepID=UPI0032E899BB